MINTAICGNDRWIRIQLKKRIEMLQPNWKLFLYSSEEELEKNHSGMAHGGFVIRSGKTGMNKEHNHIIEYSLKLDSNPEFTTSVLIAYARAAKRLYDEGQKGCKTVLDIAPAYLSEMSGEELRAHLL